MTYPIGSNAPRLSASAVPDWPDGVAGLMAAPAPVLGGVVFGRIAEAAPDHLQGRVTSTRGRSSCSAMLVTPVLTGALLDRLGPVVAAALDASALALLALALTAGCVVRGSRGEPVARVGPGGAE